MLNLLKIATFFALEGLALMLLWNVLQWPFLNVPDINYLQALSLKLVFVLLSGIKRRTCRCKQNGGETTGSCATRIPPPPTASSRSAVR